MIKIRLNEINFIVIILIFSFFANLECISQNSNGIKLEKGGSKAARAKQATAKHDKVLMELKQRMLNNPELLDEVTKQLTLDDLDNIKQMEDTFEASLRCLKVAPNESPLEKLGVDEKLIEAQLNGQIELPLDAQNQPADQLLLGPTIESDDTKIVGAPNEFASDAPRVVEQAQPVAADIVVDIDQPNESGDVDQKASKEFPKQILDNLNKIMQGTDIVTDLQPDIEGQKSKTQKGNPMNIAKCIDIFGSVGQRISNVIDGKIMAAKTSILLAGRFLRWYSQFKSMPIWERQVASYGVLADLSIVNTLRVTFARADNELSQSVCPDKVEKCETFDYIMRVLTQTINHLEADLRAYNEKYGKVDSVSIERKDVAGKVVDELIEDYSEEFHDAEEKDNQYEDENEDEDSEDDEEDYEDVLAIVSGPEVDVNKSMNRLRRVMYLMAKRRLQTESKVIINLTVQSAVFWAVSSTMTNVIGVDQNVQMQFYNIAKLLMQTDFKQIAPSYFFGMRMRPLIQLVLSFFR